MDYCKVRTNSYDTTYYEVLGKFTLVNGEVPALNIQQLIKKDNFHCANMTSYTIYNGTDFMICLMSSGLYVLTKVRLQLANQSNSVVPSMLMMEIL